MNSRYWPIVAVIVVVVTMMAGLASAKDKPNILVIWGDDVGQSNISRYTQGLVGYRTPNIDRIAEEGMTFTDYYGEQSCTAGRSSFITGQSVFRTGLSKVGLPGAKEGMNELDPTIAGLLKDQGYATGQFGKNHLGDRNEYLPTVHGFDEFFGYLYHLDAMEDPFHPNYPEDLRVRVGPRNVLHCWATDKDDPAEDPKFGRMGKQRCENTGPLTRERMETVDDETVAADTAEAAVISNRYAPEHLILHIAGARDLLPSLRNAGSVFLGPWSPESDPYSPDIGPPGQPGKPMIM